MIPIMTRALTNAERQRRYIARLKKAATSPDHKALARSLAAAKKRIAVLEDQLAHAKHQLAKRK